MLVFTAFFPVRIKMGLFRFMISSRRSIKGYRKFAVLDERSGFSSIDSMLTFERLVSVLMVDPRPMVYVYRGSKACTWGFFPRSPNRACDLWIGYLI